MSENAKPKPEEAPADGAAPAKKKSQIKLFAIVGALMVAEAAGVLAVVGMADRKPQSAEAATEVHGEVSPDEEQTVEMPLIAEKFQNMQTGRVWFWDTELVLVVKAKNEGFVKQELDRRKAEIAEGIATIFRKAQHNQLKEPGLETLNGQITAYMNRMLGTDSDGKQRIERLVIPKCRGIQAD